MNEPRSRIRQATPDDAAKIADINVRAWRHAYRGIISEPYLEALDHSLITHRVRETVKHHSTIHSTFLVAESGDTVVGYSWTTTSRDADAPPATAEIIALYVDPDVQRRGIGRVLLAQSVQAAARQAAERVTLWVLEANSSARLFYGACGFNPDGQVKTTTRWGGLPVEEVRYLRSTRGAT